VIQSTGVRWVGHRAQVGGTRDAREFTRSVLVRKGKGKRESWGLRKIWSGGFDRAVVCTWTEFVWLMVGTSEGLL